MITKHKGMCILCGRKKEAEHHLIGGTGRRHLSDEDGLTIPMCNLCHNMAIKPEDRLHGNPKAELLSKMLGEAYFIAQYGRSEDEIEKIKDIFTSRYGKNYL